jgi:hypothetical protein
MAERLRAHARAFHGVKPNPKSDFQLLANVPGRLYHRWKQKDRHFWQDRNNLKSLKRSEPEACIYV